MTELTNLLSWLENDVLLPTSDLSDMFLEPDEDDQGVLLEQRNSGRFLDDWNQIDGYIKGLVADNPLPSDVEELIDDVETTAGRKIEDIGDGDFAELSDSVRSDFRLIATGIYYNAEEPRLNGLLDLYLRGSFPCATIPQRKGAIRDLL